MMTEELGGSLIGKKVSILELAFKSGTDGVRESISIALAKLLTSPGAKVLVHDPAATENVCGVLGDAVYYSENIEGCLKDSYCCFIGAGWPTYQKLRPREFKPVMARPCIVDGRRVLKQEEF